MSVMKVAGKSDSNTAVGMAVTNEGVVKIQRIWRNEVVNLTPTPLDAVPSGTTPSGQTSTHTWEGTSSKITLPELDLSDAGAFSLRIENQTDAEMEFGFWTDVLSSKYSIRDLSGSEVTFTVKCGTQATPSFRCVVTPDDVPLLQWLKKLRLTVKPKTVPTTGSLEVRVVVKG